MSEQQEQEFSEIIDAGLEEIQSGKMTLEEVLRQHPNQAELIRPELESAMWMVSRQSAVAPRAGYISASRRRVVERIKNEAGSRRSARPSLFGFLWPQRFAYRTVAALVVVFMLLIASGGVVSAAQNTIPGDGLYGVKRLTEQFTYQVTADPARRVELSVGYSGRRLEEAHKLIARGDTDRANIALLEYQQNVALAVAELERIPESQTRQVSESAALLQSTLVAQADQLANIKNNVPAGASVRLEQAIEVTTNGISNARNKYNGANGIKPSATPTTRPSETSTDLPTSTTEPTQVWTPTAPITGITTEEVTPVSGSTTVGSGSARPSPTPTPGKTIKTPRPTNDNRQPKPEVPPGKKPGADPPKQNPPKDDPGKK